MTNSRSFLKRNEICPLTTGSPDVAGNGKAAQMIGSVQYDAIPGNAGTPADEADVGITVSITDVRLRNTNLDDYTGELKVASTLRITDRLNGPAQNEVGTVTDTQLAFTVPCTATSGGGNLGATCSLSTTADAVLPGTVSETKRTIWGMDEVQVFDGGADGVVSTSPNTMFLRQGIFVP